MICDASVHKFACLFCWQTRHSVFRVIELEVSANTLQFALISSLTGHGMIWEASTIYKSKPEVNTAPPHINRMS
jgi:hypothetical protein